MKAKLNTLMGQTQQELNSFGDAAFLQGDQHQGSLVLKLMTQFVRDFISSIEGTSPEISTKELSGGARIYYIFNDVFGNALQSIDSTSNLTSQDIRTAIRNSTGPRPSLFVPEVAFDLLVKPQIKLLEAPSLRCVEMVYEELELQRFPRLHAQLIETVSELLRERLGPTSEYTRSLIDIQAAYINTNHPAFVAGTAALAASGQMTEQPSRKRVDGPKARLSEPASISGTGADDDEDETSSAGAPNGPHIIRGGEPRSVSSTVHDRLKASNAANPSPNGIAVPGTSTPPSHHHSSHKLRTASHSTAQAGTSPHGTARDSFMTYFFGGSQGGANALPQAGPSNSSPTAAFASRAGRDSIGKEFGIQENGRESPTIATMAAKAGAEPGNAAFDMKSLGKHIEAISSSQSALSPRDEMETNLIRSLIASYFAIVRQTIQDLVPKAIMHLLVNHTSQQVQNRLVSTLYKPDLFAELLHEDDAIANERARVKALLDAYKEAFKTLAEVNLTSI
ncbi:Dynamin- GTPase protein [Tulasnella sp. 408]|nr:Dynamin- GTPase protein [Tulasnella sp. 408]